MSDKQPSLNLCDQLCLAAQKGEIETVKTLLNTPELDVNEASSISGANALLCAAIHGQAKVVELLLQQPNLNINYTTTYGATALALAARQQHLNVVEALLKHPGINETQVKETIDFLSQMSSSEDILHRLHKHLTDIETHKKLLNAAQKGQDELLESITQKPDVLNKQLLIAYQKKQPELINKLLTLLNGEQKRGMILDAVENDFPPALLEQLKGDQTKVSDLSVFTEKRTPETSSEPPKKGIDFDSI
jgi:ankyrin repeat protein